MSQADDVLRALSCGNTGCKCNRAERNGGGLTHCPAHQDPNPSLNLEEKEGRLIWKCHGGCSQEAVLEALRERRLLNPRANGSRPARRLQVGPRSRGKTLEALRQEMNERGALREKVWEIRDTSGSLVAYHPRWDFANGHGKELAWASPDGRLGLGGLSSRDLPLYGSELLPGRPEAPVVLTEGEKAADALRAAGVLALGTVTGAAITPKPEVLAALQARHKVVLWPDADKAGQQHMARIARALQSLGIPVHVVDWPEAPTKADAADYLSGHSREELRELLRQAPALKAEGNQGQPGEPEIRMRKMTTDPPIFLLEFADLGEIRVSGAQLQRWRAVELACMEQLPQIPTWAPRNQHEWQQVYQRLHNTAEVVEPPPELTLEGRVTAYLRRFCERALDVPDALRKGAPWFDEDSGLYIFRLEDFLSHVRWSGEVELRRQRVVEGLERIGAGPHENVKPRAWALASERLGDLGEEEKSDD